MSTVPSESTVPKDSTVPSEPLMLNFPESEPANRDDPTQNFDAATNRFASHDPIEADPIEADPIEADPQQLQ